MKRILLVIISLFYIFGCEYIDQKEVTGNWMVELSGNRVQFLTLKEDGSYTWVEILKDINGEVVLEQSAGSWTQEMLSDMGLISPCLMLESEDGKSLFLEYQVGPDSLLLVEEEGSLFIRVDNEYGITEEGQSEE